MFQIKWPLMSIHKYGKSLSSSYNMSIAQLMFWWNLISQTFKYFDSAQLVYILDMKNDIYRKTILIFWGFYHHCLQKDFHNTIDFM